MDVGIHATEDGGSFGRRKVVAAEGAAETERAIPRGAGTERSKEKDVAGCWPREPGDRWGWTFLPSRRGLEGDLSADVELSEARSQKLSFREK